METYIKNQEMVDDLLGEALKWQCKSSEWFNKKPPKGQSRNHQNHMGAQCQGTSAGLKLAAQMICEHSDTSVQSNPADTVRAIVCDDCNKTLDVE